MRVDAVVARLTACGLTEKEARALAHLTHLGKSKVTDLAKAASLKRAETYQILERLQSRGRTTLLALFMAVAALVTVGAILFFPEDQPRVLRGSFTLVALAVAVLPFFYARRRRSSSEGESRNL